ncbi:hypothetical protein C8J56DRAFT_903085 [Mycena floridula]|nr:hypothetical protein C8J56DRAFT_903085 [Mycena floridula]
MFELIQSTQCMDRVYSVFFPGLLVGPLFDLGHHKIPLLLASTLFVLSTFLTAVYAILAFFDLSRHHRWSKLSEYDCFDWVLKTDLGPSSRAARSMDPRWLAFRSGGINDLA